jgi:hypothetical protein
VLYADSVSIHIKKLKKWFDKNPRQLSNYWLTVNDNENKTPEERQMNIKKTAIFLTG